MDSSDQRNSMSPSTASLHRPPFLRHHHHHHLEFSPHCPLHGGYLLHPNNHHHHNTPTHGHRHHHHHLELSPDCPIHSSNFHSRIQSTTSFPICPNFAHPVPLPRNPELFNPNVDDLNCVPPEADKNIEAEALMMQERSEEVEDEIIFVLTDEWKEFFAKSEAKRRLAKKQAKKQSKN